MCLRLLMLIEIHKYQKAEVNKNVERMLNDSN